MFAVGPTQLQLYAYRMNRITVYVSRNHLWLMNLQCFMIDYSCSLQYLIQFNNYLTFKICKMIYVASAGLHWTTQLTGQLQMFSFGILLHHCLNVLIFIMLSSSLPSFQHSNPVYVWLIHTIWICISHNWMHKYNNWIINCAYPSQLNHLCSTQRLTSSSGVFHPL